MGNRSIREYYIAMAVRYKNAETRAEKSYLILEISLMALHHRKHVIRKLNQLLKGLPSKVRPGRRPSYSNDAKFHLKKLWLQMKQICSKRLKPALKVWIKFYQAPGFTNEVKAEILKMSASSIDRFLAPHRSEHGRKLRTGTRKNWITTVIPIKLMDQRITEPGFMEADTAAHCGGSLSGRFAWTLTMVDVDLRWTFNRAIWGCEAKASIPAIRAIEELLPYALKGFNVDNGREFINGDLVYYSQHLDDGSERKEPLKVTRSRVSRKNDNCFVEQKHFTHVRELFGYIRIDHQELVGIMNEIYHYDNIIQNFFLPQMKMIKKIRIGSKYKRKYDKPRTAYHRTLDSNKVTKEDKINLKIIYKKYNPFQLGQQLENLLKKFYKRMDELNNENKNQVA